MSFPEKRRDRRLELFLPLRLRGQNSSGNEFEENTVTVDVSASGIYFLARAKLGVHTSVGISITIPEDLSTLFPSPRLDGEAKVVRIDKPPKNHPEFRQYGVACELGKSLRLVMIDE